jgi:phage shock protein C
MIAGVCGGLAVHLGLDPLLVRVAFVLFALGGGCGVLLYIILWILMPQEEP